MKNKVFIVEDDFLLVRLYKRAFEFDGFETESAYDGEEALSKIKEMVIKPAVILLDIMMPKMNGLDFLKEIKKIPELSNIPVAVFTNVAEKDERENAMSLGASAYLLKGEKDIKDVVAEINSLIKK